MLRDRRRGNRNPRPELVDGVFTRCQRLERPTPGRLCRDFGQVEHTPIR